MNLRPSAIAFCLALLGAHLRAASLPVLVKAGGMVESMFSGNNQSLSNASFYLQTRQTASAQITASAQATETSFSIIASANIVADPGDVYPPRSPFYPETVDAYASITDIADQGPNAYFTFGESNAFACEVSLPYAPSHDGSLNPSFSVGFYDAINSHTIFSFGTSGGSGPLVKTKSGVVPPGTYYVQLNAYWGWTAGYDAKGWQGHIFVYDYGPAFSLSSSYSAAISFVSLARPDLAAVKLALDLTAANAVCT
jgi:hypothetical protein